jgi:hypothetical protein
VTFSLPSAGHPDRPVLRIDKICAAAGVRDLVHVNQCRELLFLESTTAIWLDWFAAVRKQRLVTSQPPSCRKRAAPIVAVFLLVVDVLIADQRIWPVSFTLTMNSGCSCEATIAATRGSDAVFLRVHGHAARRDDLQWLAVAPSMIVYCGGQ